MVPNVQVLRAVQELDIEIDADHTIKVLPPKRKAEMSREQSNIKKPPT